MVGEYMIEDLAGVPVEVEYASEFRYRNPIIKPGTLVIAISQSGETADTLAALKEAQQKGATALAICNGVGSTIARTSDGGGNRRSQHQGVHKPGHRTCHDCAPARSPAPTQL